MEKKEVKACIILLVIVLIIASGFLIVHNILKNKDKNEKTTTTAGDTTTTTKAIVVPPKSSHKFDIESESGYVTVTGYAEMKHLKIEDEDDEGFEEADYVYFHVTNCDNSDFMQYLKDHKGNLFVQDKAIGLGTIENDQLSYYNAYDDDEENLQIYEYTFSKEDTQYIMNSSKTNTIKLNLDKLVFTNGFGGGPLSYSHMTFIEIVK